MSLWSWTLLAWLGPARAQDDGSAAVEAAVPVAAPLDGTVSAAPAIEAPTEQGEPPSDAGPADAPAAEVLGSEPLVGAVDGGTAIQEVRVVEEAEQEADAEEAEGVEEAEEAEDGEPPPTPTEAPPPARVTFAPPIDFEALRQSRQPAPPPSFLPPAPEGGVGSAFMFAFLALLCVVGAQAAGWLGRRLTRTGMVPALLRAAVGMGRGLSVPLGILAMLALMPPAWSRAAPVVVVAIAAALGWTTRDLLADLFAGVVLATERRVRVGQRLEAGEHRGVVTAVGLRTTTLVGDDGRSVALPNRRLMDAALRIDPDRYAPVLVPIHVGHGVRVGHVHQTLEELVLLSPYLAPGRRPNVFRDPEREDVWIVEARLVNGRFANAFRGALVELADEVIGGRE